MQVDRRARRGSCLTLSSTRPAVPQDRCERSTFCPRFARAAGILDGPPAVSSAVSERTQRMSKLSKASIALGLLALVAVAVAYGARSHKSASDTLVFGSSADPVALDGALISDGESGRVVNQIFEGLVGLKPGTTTVVPALATSWKSSHERAVLDVHAAQGREVQRRHAVQRGGGLRQLQPLVQLHRLVPEPERRRTTGRRSSAASRPTTRSRARRRAASTRAARRTAPRRRRST